MYADCDMVANHDESVREPKERLQGKGCKMFIDGNEEQAELFASANVGAVRASRFRKLCMREQNTDKIEKSMVQGQVNSIFTLFRCAFIPQ